MVNLGRKKNPQKITLTESAKSTMIRTSGKNQRGGFFQKKLQNKKAATTPKTPPVTTPEPSPRPMSVETVHVAQSQKNQLQDGDTIVSDLTVNLLTEDKQPNPLESNYQQQQEQPETPQTSLVTTVLGMVDMSCVSNFQQQQEEEPKEKDLREVLSFKNEWGMKPTDDDERKQRKSPDRKRHETFELVYQEPKFVANKLWRKKKKAETTVTTPGTLGIQPSPVVEPIEYQKRNNGSFLQRALSKQPSNKAEPPAPPAEPRQRKVLTSIKSSKLDTVEEEASDDSLSEMKVHVPGEDSYFLSDKDLIGDEVVEDIYATLEAILKTEKEPKNLVQTTITETEQVVVDTKEKPISPKKAGYQEWKSDEEDDEEEKVKRAVEPKRTTSWKNRLLGSNNKKTEATEDKSKKKPVWKAVVDPNTGRTYYYHRKTRETTWNKPADFVVSKKSVAQQPPDPTKTAISNLWNKLAPTQEDNLDRLASQYEGRDKELLEQLEELAAARPFDEPIPNHKDEKSVAARTHTSRTVFSSSHRSRISEKTEQIRNTANKMFSNRDGVRDLASQATSISSKHGVPPARSPLLARGPAKIPKNIPVPRARELNVEEFSTRDRDYRTRRVTSFTRATKENTEDDTDGNNNNHNKPVEKEYLGDDEHGSLGRDTESYAGTDSISALSEADLSYVDRKEAMDDVRRRALHRAVAQQDWDLAAQLSEGMRKSSGQRRRTVPPSVSKEWTQTEMDRFISENDWDAVAACIARLRANARDAERKAINRHLKGRRSAPRGQPMAKGPGPQKRFGARSQLQHHDTSSDGDSSSSGSTDSEYTTDSSEEEDILQDREYARQRKEFAC